MSTAASTHSTAARPTDDGELIRRMARGDKLACSTFYDRFSRPIYSVALRILNDQAEAEDVVQDVFLTLWKKAATYNASRGSAFGWAITLTRNRAIDRLRLRRRHSTLLQQSSPDDLPGGHATSDTHSADDLILREKTSAVRAALSTLPSEKLRTLELAFFSGLTQQEIATQLGEPLSTVKARIRRGLLKLRDTLTRGHD